MPGERHRLGLFLALGGVPIMRSRVPLYVACSGEDLRKAEGASLASHQGLMDPLGPQTHDPAYATHAQVGKPGHDVHVQAAMHYIQADYHGRHPGGWNQAQEHHKQFMELRKQGANPTAQHFSEAMRYLHPKFSQAMKSQPGLFVSL